MNSKVVVVLLAVAASLAATALLVGRQYPTPAGDMRGANRAPDAQSVELPAGQTPVASGPEQFPAAAETPAVQAEARPASSASEVQQVPVGAAPSAPSPLPAPTVVAGQTLIEDPVSGVYVPVRIDSAGPSDKSEPAPVVPSLPEQADDTRREAAAPPLE